ncbi:hypothetical protein DSM25558_4685 [Agrobacterium sp. DSM 25558]|uniref:hypothetical protein n=1 Tax=Agrobacterium sp. DSM 25558 TaxID=1907665 RepID=UPI0009725F81|nr:hypothetical protein [Agrobacterium sp. DSM 25558]SCX29422.1 hypothetical protein DSM25558_4685 [Agrobacterium sp. DSM 25558]
MKDINTHTTPERAYAHGNSKPFKQSEERMEFLFSTGHKLEAFRRPDGELQLNWMPGIPPLSTFDQRGRIVPNYHVAIREIRSTLGGGTIHGALPESVIKLPH